MRAIFGRATRIADCDGALNGLEVSGCLSGCWLPEVVVEVASWPLSAADGAGVPAVAVGCSGYRRAVSANTSPSSPVCQPSLAWSVAIAHCRSRESATSAGSGNG